MPADLVNEFYSIVPDFIPEWFYNLSSGDRNTIMTAAQAEYDSATNAKNSSFETYFAALILPYTP